MTTRNIQSDWFTRATQRIREFSLTQAHSAMSSAFSRRRRTEDRIKDFHETARIVQNMVRAQGVPANTRVEWAKASQNAAGAAGFEDAPSSFEIPFIWLDPAIYESHDQEHALNVLLGVAVHEGAHLKFSREIYKRPNSGRVRLYENLFEDERIESLERTDSPGYAVYLETARYFLFERGPIGEAICRWNDLPDLDKANTIVMAFIRCPHLLTPELQQWTTITGLPVLDRLRESFPAAPQTEDDVASFATRLDKLWAEEIAKPYARPQGGSEKAENDEECSTTVDEHRKRLEHQWSADTEDESLTNPESQGEQASKKHRGKKSRNGRSLDHNGALLARGNGRRFGVLDAHRMLDHQTEIQGGLSPDDSVALSKLVADACVHVVVADAWGWGDSSRQTIVHHPQPTKDGTHNYQAAVCRVRDQVAAMRSAFGFRTGELVEHSRHRSRGRVDRRRLSRATITDRVFRQSRIVPAKGMALCLLLDESASMVGRSKMTRALDVAVLTTEAFKDIAHIELEIYSFTSCGSYHQDSQITYLLGRSNQDRRSLGEYGRGQCRLNYDHQAILSAAQLLRRNTDQDRRLMIVLSDGAPNGHKYGGQPAILATREAVQQTRRQGIQVLGVAIEDYDSAAIYGAQHIVKLTSMTTFVDDMRRLLTRTIRQTL